jgi:hypothetical protein
MKQEYIECEVSLNADGSVSWHHEGVIVFCVHSDGTKEDMRRAPPYLSMSPCPYCRERGPKVAGIKGHIALSHVDPRLGTPV